METKILVDFYDKKICRISFEDTIWTIIKPTSDYWDGIIQLTIEDAYGVFQSEKIKTTAFIGLYKDALKDKVDEIVEFLKK